MKKLVLLFTIALIATGTCFAQTSKFTYQGRLSDGGAPANGNYDFQIDLYDLPKLGNAGPVRRRSEYKLR